MKKQTFDLMNFGHALGREEMKKLMAGSGGCDGTSCQYDQISGWRCFYTGSSGISCDDSGYPNCQERPC